MRRLINIIGTASLAFCVASCAHEPVSNPNEVTIGTGFHRIRSERNGIVSVSFTGTGEASGRRATVSGDGRNPYALTRLVLGNSVSDDSLAWNKVSGIDTEMGDNLLLNDHFKIDQTKSWSEALEAAKDFILTGRAPKMNYQSLTRSVAGTFYKCSGVLENSAEAEMPDPADENTVRVHLRSSNQLSVYDRKELNQFDIFDSSSIPTRLPITQSVRSYDAAYLVARAHCNGDLGRRFN